MLTMLPCALGQSLDTPMTRLRPIDAVSAVDRYRGPAETANYRETAYQQANSAGRTQSRQVGTTGHDESQVRQAAMQQPFTAPQLPATAPGSFALPPATSPSPPPNSVVIPQASSPGLPSNPGLPSTGNLIPVPQNRSILVPNSGDSSDLRRSCSLNSAMGSRRLTIAIVYPRLAITRRQVSSAGVPPLAIKHLAIKHLAIKNLGPTRRHRRQWLLL